MSVIVPSGSLYFYPRSPCGERPGRTHKAPMTTMHFYPRSPCGERRPFRMFIITIIQISIHALLAESDLPPPISCFSLSSISIHALLAESDWAWTGGLSYERYFYPRSPCGERPQTATKWASSAKISIHALLAESDFKIGKNFTDRSYFYPRSPCGERRVVSIQVGGDIYFYPRSPCGERP